MRLYQSSIFVKEPSHGETAWHTDLGTSPFDTDGMVMTALSVMTTAISDDHGS